MNNKLHYLFFILLYILPAEGAIVKFPCNPLRFEENKGQVTDQFLNPRNDVLFIARNKNFKIILKKNSFSYEFNKLIDGKQPANPKKSLKNFIEFPDDFQNGEIKYQIHRIDVELLNANPVPEVIKKGKSINYNNYICNEEAQTGIYFCFSYDTIIYKNIYDNIDLVFYSLENTTDTAMSIKYDFVIRPGGKTNQIKLKYDGASELSLIKGRLNIRTSLGNLTETIPLSYIDDYKKVNVNYDLGNNVITFNTENFNMLKTMKGKTLTIDPYLMYGTYYGDDSEDIGMGICTDTNNNFVLTGFTSSVDNIATQGAYQTDMEGGPDAFIVKFNSAGDRLWATYFGSTDYDTSHDLVTDKSGNIYIVGWTKSKTGIATPGVFQSNFAGGEFDSYLAKFNSVGQLQWATYFGGQYDDYINDITIDGYSNIVFIGRTSSSTKIATSSGYQPAFGGNFDAFLEKFSPDGNRIWGTYYGGTGFDVGMELSTDIFNNIAITGFTQSSNDIASEGAHKDSLSGIWDAFIAKFSSDGERLWGTYYGGTDNDNGWGIASDGSENIYIIGNTLSHDNIATTGSHKDILISDEIDGFVAKFNSYGNRLWSSYFGGGDEDYGNVGLIDPWNNFLFAGDTFSDSSIATDDAPQTGHAGNYDAYISKFSSNGSQIWGTYHGGGMNEYCHGLAMDKNSRLFLIGYTYSSSGIATSAGFQNRYGGDADAYLAKFGDAIPQDSIFIENFGGLWCADNTIIIPYSISGTFTPGNVFTAQLSNAAGLFKEFHDIGSLASTESGTITAYIPKEIINGTNYRIRIVSSYPEVISPDNGINLTVYELPKPVISGPIDVCSENYYQYAANQSTSLNYKWIVTEGEILTVDDEDNIDIQWYGPGIGKIKLIETNSITGCIDSIETEITIHQKVEVSGIFGSTDVCPNVDYIYNTSESSSISCEWLVIGGKIIGENNNDSVIVQWEEDADALIKLKQVSIESGCMDSTEMSISTYPLPEPFVIGDTIIKAYSTSIYRTPPVSGYDNLWTVEGGTIDGIATGNVIQVDWGIPGIGSVCLHQTNKDTYCEDSTKYVIDIQLLSDDIISGDSIVCAYSRTEYNADDTLFFYYWEVEGGEILGDTNKSNLIIIWNEPGNGIIRLYRENKTDSTKDSVSMKIEILSSPRTDFSGNNEVCEGFVEYYYTNHIDSIINEWVVYNGTIVSNDNPDSVQVKWGPVSNNEDSVYVIGSLTLIRTDPKTNCSNEKTLTIFVNKNPDVEVEGDTLVCAEEYLSYTTKAENGSTFHWKISGGIITDNTGDTSIVVQWKDEGLGFVLLIETASNNCIDSLIMNIIISPSPEKPFISQSGKILISSAVDGNQWFLSGDLIEGANSKYYSPPDSGIFTVQVTAENKCKSEMSDPYNFDINPVEDNPDNDNIIEVYPNPVNDFIYIEIKSQIIELVHLQVYNLLGQVLINSVGNSCNGQLTTLDLSALNSGIYILSISFNGKNKNNYRIVKY
ncbi:SBBP repeat-containing protein [Bacteroidota bacterium]